uniref:Thiamine biosynthesis protein S n=1 Tax=Aureoumbra lagunensis TaxID=44058 RepID=C6KIZ4_9STRA|nr:thiamine biosynthesis protein S [Aureoumbra lagunensis]ACS36950.1 thiamine biosynthesis protein S [Aureoumbra lagunensis]
MGIHFFEKLNKMSITVQLNGAEYILERGITILELLKFLSLNKDSVALEHNSMLVSKKEYQNIYLQDKDQLEIVSIVGGG